MQESEARAWWAEVEHLRERIEARSASATPAAAELTSAPRGLAQPAAPRARRTVVIAGRGAPAPVVAPRALVDAEPLARQRSADRSRATGGLRVNAGFPGPRVAERVTGRPDRIAMWAMLLGLALMLVATGSASAATSLGERTLKVPMKGRDVRQLQGHLKDAGLLPAQATAYYGPLTRNAVRRYQRSRCLTADGIAGPATLRALQAGEPRCAAPDSGDVAEEAVPQAGGLRDRVVTWYGPGLYGRRTACGERLTRRLVGVAHRTLPCGTRVRFVHGGRSVVARVVDRGPHTSGVEYDLTWAAAHKLRVITAGRLAVRASH